MKAYQDIVKETLEGGHKHPVRFDENGDIAELDNGTVGIFAAIFRHDMSEGFPLLTTKKMSLKTIAVELEGFIKGITSKKWYQEKGCKIWNEWANPKQVKLNMARWGYLFDDKEGQKEVMRETDDLGPIYGYQWSNFNKCYDEYDDGCVKNYDQFKDICEKLRENPHDRRMVVSAWNPVQISRMALPPCHFAWNVVVYDNKLNLIWHQRSCDLMLGVPFNIASYGLLLLLLAKHSGLEPGELVGTLNDCHIYTNQIDNAREQLLRTPRALPSVYIQSNNILEWNSEDIQLEGYSPHPPLQFGLTVH